MKFLFGRRKVPHRKLVGLQREIDLTRSRIDVPADLVLKFQNDMNSPEFLAVYEKPEPLVSICVATYNRADILVDRTIASLMAQTYKNIEIVVVGDHCTDHTAEKIAACNDPRIRFENLAERGNYPPEGRRRWLVAGTTPMNRALDLAQGDFVCNCDDDDEFDPRKVELMVAFAKESKAHFLWHPFMNEKEIGKWQLIEAPELAKNSVTTSAIFYHRWLKDIHWDIEAWRYDEPGDWNRIRRILYLGATTARFGEPLIKHYKERNQRSA